MNKKIRIAFIYKSSNVFLTGKHFDNNYYHFFMDALKRNLELDVSYFPAEKFFDTSILKNNFDVILLWENHPWGTPDELIGIKSLNIPVICKVNDAHDAHAKGKIQYHEKYKIDYYFGYLPESFFHKYYPKDFKYKMIIYGLDYVTLITHRENHPAQNLYKKYGYDLHRTDDTKDFYFYSL